MPVAHSLRAVNEVAYRGHLIEAQQSPGANYHNPGARKRANQQLEKGIRGLRDALGKS